MSYKSDLQQNNADLQSILNDVNNLPVAENISDLLDEQETKLNELLTVLDGKAAGGGGAVEKYNLRILVGDDNKNVVYMSSSTEFSSTTSPGDYDCYGGVFMVQSTDLEIDADKEYAMYSIAGWTIVKAYSDIIITYY